MYLFLQQEQYFGLGRTREKNKIFPLQRPLWGQQWQRDGMSSLAVPLRAGPSLSQAVWLKCALFVLQKSQPGLVVPISLVGSGLCSPVCSARESTACLGYGWYRAWPGPVWLGGKMGPTSPASGEGNLTSCMGSSCN